MPDELRVALLQMRPGADTTSNTRTAVAMAEEGAAAGAGFVFLPEYAAMFHASGRTMRHGAIPEDAHPMLSAMRDFAARAGAWVLIGSLTIPGVAGRVANRSYLIASDGALVARYDKIHMFDATLPNGRVVRESSLYEPGDEAIVAATPWGSLGLSICYDLRFPQLYRALAQAGATMLAVPSAFTASTGALHWHALLRARAIENAAWVIAPATTGEHPGGHATYGHSLVVDPSGHIVVDGGNAPGVVMADIRVAAADAARARIPSVLHSPSFTLRATRAATGRTEAPHEAAGGSTAPPTTAAEESCERVE